MRPPSLEKLMAYADGALDEKEAQEIESYVQTDEKAQQMLADFARTDDYLRLAFEAPMLEPPPQALIDTIMNTKATPQSATVSNISAKQANHRIPAPWVPSLMAASVAFIIGGALGFFGSESRLETTQGVSVGALTSESELAIALTRNPSGKKIELKSEPQPTAITVVSSFRDGGGRICREFEAENAKLAGMISAIACRQPQGEWVVEGASRIAMATAAEPKAYVPSGASAQEPLSGVLSMLSAGKALSPSEENAILSEWAKTLGNKP